MNNGQIILCFRHLRKCLVYFLIVSDMSSHAPLDWIFHISKCRNSYALLYMDSPLHIHTYWITTRTYNSRFFFLKKHESTMYDRPSSWGLHGLEISPCEDWMMMIIVKSDRWILHNFWDQENRWEFIIIFPILFTCSRLDSSSFLHFSATNYKLSLDLLIVHHVCPRPQEERHIDI